MRHLIKIVLLGFTLLTGLSVQAQNKKEQALLKEAYKHLSINAQYKYGGTNNIDGFDGSGFIQYIYQYAIGLKLARRSADQAKQGRTIALVDAQIGDLLFFSGSKIDNKIQQVGIVVEQTDTDTFMIYVGNSKGVAKTAVRSSKYWKERFIIAKTIIH